MFLFLDAESDLPGAGDVHDDGGAADRQHVVLVQPVRAECRVLPPELHRTGLPYRRIRSGRYERRKGGQQSFWLRPPPPGVKFLLGPLDQNSETAPGFMQGC